MDKEFHAWLSESNCRDFFLYEIILFYVFELCNTFSGVISEWMQKRESDCHQKERVKFKDQDFLARFSCIIEITSCEKFHRKKTSWYDMRPLDQTRLTYNCAHLRLNNKKDKNKLSQNGSEIEPWSLTKCDLTTFSPFQTIFGRK